MTSTTPSQETDPNDDRPASPPEDPTPVTDPGAAIEAPRPDGLPKRSRRAASGERSALDIARRIVELAEDKKAADIVLLDLTGLTTIADNFVICSAGSERQLDAIADGIIEGLRAEGCDPSGGRAWRSRTGFWWTSVRRSSTSSRPSGTSTDLRSTGSAKTILRVQ